MVVQLHDSLVHLLAHNALKHVLSVNYVFAKGVDKGEAFEVLEWIRNIIQHYTGHVIIYSCWD